MGLEYTNPRDDLREISVVVDLANVEVVEVSLVNLGKIDVLLIKLREVKVLQEKRR